MSTDVMDVMKFNETLQAGQAGVVRWTNSNNFYKATGTVSKVNKSSLRITLTQDICGLNGVVIYRSGRDIIVPRCAFQCIERWSRNNGFFPAD